MTNFLTNIFETDYNLMINQAEQASNQYGFYAVPKALQPKKKYRQTFQQQSKYSGEEAEEDNQFENLERDQENQKQIQRDFYVDEAPYPQFKPKQRGLDYGVQIQRHQLFDFDLEVQPLVQILVGRSVVTAINELQQQKQGKERQSALDQYQKKRNAQLMLTQRLQNKHNRKQDQVKRRVLQKQTYTKNRKIATQKLIARKNAKHDLINLRNQVLGQLEDQGFLSQSTYLSLRVQYESWLYQQIKSIVNQHKKIQQAAENIVTEKQKQITKQHQKHIDNQNKRRKDILDERQRVRKQNQERKLKKKIRKQRLALNAERVVKHDQAVEQLQKYEAVQKILKAQSLSNGLTKRKNTGATVHLAGGLLNYVLTMINASGNHSVQQIQTILQKLLSQLSTKLQIDISAAHIAKIQEMKAKMEADPIQFMTYKETLINDLSQRISLDISILQGAGISLKSQVHNNIINALMNIYLNSLPPPKMQGDQIVGAYEPNDKDKKREQLKHKLQIISTQSNNLEQIKKTQNVVRVRFQKVKNQQTQSKQNKDQGNKEQQEEEKPVDLDQWINVYDGQDWERKKREQQKQVQRENQHASSYALNGFSNTFVIDERNLYYLQIELEKLLGIQGGEELTKYKERLQYLVKQSDKIPIYDIQMLWE